MQMDLKTGVSIIAMIVAGVSAYYAFVTTASEGIRNLERKIAELEVKLHEPKASAAFPEGAVIASLQQCAQLGTGWVAFEEGQGRVIVGVGATEDERGETRVFSKAEDRGGKFRHELTIAEMPTHDHGGQTDIEIHPHTGIWYDTGQGTERWKAPVVGDVAINRDKKHTHGIAAQGGGNPHDNMPPYIALYFCIKQGSK